MREWEEIGPEVVTGRTWRRFWKVFKAMSFSKPKEATEYWVESQETAECVRHVPLVSPLAPPPAVCHRPNVIT